MKSSEFLRECLKKMNNGGKHWIKGAYSQLDDGETRYCSVGAMKACNKFPSIPFAVYWDAQEELARVIKKKFRNRVRHEEENPSIIIAFNDHIDTVWEDICNVFKEAIKNLELQGK